MSRVARSYAPRFVAFVLLALALKPGPARAQSLEPRLYLPLPIGTHAVGLSYAYSDGNVIVEGALPVKDFTSTMGATTLAYSQSFGLFGRTAQFQAIAPVAFGSAHAVIAGRDSTRDLTGLGDPMVRLAVNLAGGPARRRSEMAGVRLGTIVGASFSVSPPLGHYDTDRRLNVGSHRWSFKPELGLVQPLGGRRAWWLEAYGSVTVFSDNTAYVDTATVTQESLWALQGHFVRVFGRRAWVALDGTVVQGGSTFVDGTLQNNFQKSVRLGVTAAWFVRGPHSLRGSLSSGVYRGYGGDFDVLSLGYLYAWGR